MKTIDDLIKDAGSILNTLDKDYEAMQSQKSDVRQDQVSIFNSLCENMAAVLGKYSKTIHDFRSKIDRSRDARGTKFTVYEYPDEHGILTMVPELYWTAGDGRPTFLLFLHEEHTNHDAARLCVSETGIDETRSFGFGDDGYSDLVSVFLNHCPTYEQLDTAFQTALTGFIEYCVKYVQERNEKLADKIKAITL